jgi:hypothetical protein
MIYDLDQITPEYNKARQALATARAKETRAMNAWLTLRRTDANSAETMEAHAKAKQASEATIQARELLSAIIHTAPAYTPEA